jgi:hypothetical protein
VQLAPFVVLQLLQLWKLLAGAAVSVTVVPVANCELQDDPTEHVIPAGELVMVPVTVPATVTVRIGKGPAGVQPRLDGPSTVIVAELLKISLSPLCISAKTCATPQSMLGEAIPVLVI